MTGAFVILIAMVVIGIVLYITDVLYYRKRQSPADNRSADTEAAAGTPGTQADGRPGGRMPGDGSVPGDDSQCCGMHTVCEKTNLSPVTGEIVYYDDEELDRFKGRTDDEYSPGEIEEFRDVLLTLLPEDVAGWSRSIQVRGITLPAEIRDELLMIVGELRASGK